MPVQDHPLKSPVDQRPQRGAEDATFEADVSASYDNFRRGLFNKPRGSCEYAKERKKIREAADTCVGLTHRITDKLWQAYIMKLDPIISKDIPVKPDQLHKNWKYSSGI